ncbi:MAG: Xaa-Pro peptidase family protein [Gemmatimonadetes bacterium]|nr:Xaa-Pro peptidase family protein [Gemmatimonadota bacterium]
MLFNVERAREFMRECGLDALIATSPVNITYFTDYFIWIDGLMKEYMVRPGGSADLAQGYALFPLDGEPALAVTGSMLAVNGADLRVRDLRISGDSGLDWSLPPRPLPDRMDRLYTLLKSEPDYGTTTEALAGALGDRGLSGGTLGVEADGMTAARYEELRQALPGARLLDCSNLIRLLRMVKTGDEIDRLAQAAEISEAAAMTAMEQASPGDNVQDVIHRFRAELGKRGADLDHFAFGVHGLGIATEPDFILGESEVEYVDWGCRYRSCYSDTGTTFAMEPLSDDMQDRFDVLRASMDAGLAAIRPGVNASTVQAAMQDVVDGAGLAMYPHGHGVGMEVRDYPVLAPDNGLSISDDCVDIPSDLPIEEDMVLNVEAPLCLAGVGSLHLEQSVVVTESGSRPLTDQQRDRPVFPLGATN